MAENHSRAIELEGGYNFRDLGGYTTKDGRQIAWRKLFRSGKLNELTQTDRNRVMDLGIKSVVDFRRLPERTDAPSLWHDDHEPYIATHPHPNDMAEGGASIFGQLVNEEISARDLMIQVYREMPEDYAAHYTEMLRLLANRTDCPLLFHCTAGKDRTGLGAYLILHVLGVEEDLIFEDYLLTNQFYPADHRLMQIVQRALDEYGLKTSDPEVFRPMVAVDADYLRSAITAIQQEYGSVEAYLEKRLGVTETTKETVRANLLD